jgi:DtxR family transcriptional regulator, Mn-dependent transcriptional regulator
MEDETRQTLSKAIEDYLKVIYELNQREGRATTNAVAEQMGVSAASATNMLQKLAASHPPLVEYRKHQGVMLTVDGEKTALGVLRSHRLLEMFLHEVLGYEWDEVHAEADRLEHAVSKLFVERIAVFLNNPAQDPHGDPIPSPDLVMPGSAEARLYDLRAGQSANVKRVWSREGELLRFLGDQGIVPGAHLEVLSFNPFDESLQIMVEGKAEPQVIGPGISKKVFVES